MVLEDFGEIIDYAKYLGCEGCRKVGLYCVEHRIEVEEMLSKHKGRVPKSQYTTKRFKSKV